MTTFLSFNIDGFYSNCTKLSENLRKFTKTLVLKFQTNAIFIQRGIDILRTDFLIAHRSIIANSFFHYFIHNSIQELINK